MKENEVVLNYSILQSQDDEILCRMAQKGNRDAEEILVSRYHRLVRSAARPFFLTGGDTEDLLQEGMFGLIKAIREYDNHRDASFFTFADHCVRNRLYSALRAASSGKHSPLNQAVPLDPSFFDESIPFAQVDPEVVLIDAEKAEYLLHMARQQLSVFEQKVLGFYLDGLTCREIADTVGKSPKSVDNAVQRIRRKIGRRLTSGELSNS